MNRQQDNEYLIQEAKWVAARTLRWVMTTMPGIAVGVTGYYWEIALIVGIAVAGLALIWTFGFREWRVQRSKMWTSPRERAEEEARHDQDKAWFRYPALGVAIAAIGVIGHREIGTIVNIAQSLL